MKLKPQNWKAAWFDSHISERFFNEMSRLEKTALANLETSAQWMEQLMIEVGQLAQAMIRLEKNDTPEPQIRHAMEKALRLSALSLQLMTTLDGLDRDLLKSGQRQFAVEGSASHPFPPAVGAGQTTVDQPEEKAPPPEESNPAQQPDPPTSPLPPFLMRQIQPRPDSEAPREPLLEPLPDLKQQKRKNVFDDTVPLINPFLSLAPKNSETGKSRMRDTIVSLSDQGLSRAEIEAVTDEPRHVIEAVLNHAREG